MKDKRRAIVLLSVLIVLILVVEGLPVFNPISANGHGPAGLPVSTPRPQDSILYFANATPNTYSWSVQGALPMKQVAGPNGGTSYAWTGPVTLTAGRTYNGTFTFAYDAQMSMVSGASTSGPSVGTVWANLTYGSTVYVWTHKFNQQLLAGETGNVSIAPNWSVRAESQHTPIVNITLSSYGGMWSSAPSDVITHAKSGKGVNVFSSLTFHDTSQAVPFVWGYTTKYAYTTTFHETGLPATHEWIVNVTGGGNTYGGIYTSSASIGVDLPNGTYTWTAQTPNKTYSPSPASGTVTVIGADQTIDITFTLVTYTITFTESGLPASTTWYLNLTNGQKFSSTSTTISFTEPNATYYYTLADANPNYQAIVVSSLFTVNGANANIAASFAANVHVVKFIESGLSPGTAWSVTLNGTTASSVSNNITFREREGTVNYTRTQNMAFVADQGANAISIINTTDNTVLLNFSVSPQQAPYAIAMLPNGRMLYVTEESSDNVSVINTTTDIIVTNIKVGNTPEGIAITPNGNYVYVANEGSDTVSVISTSTNAVTATIAVGGAPFDVAISPNGSYAYVVNSLTTSDNVTVISTSTNKPVANIPVGSSPNGIAIAPDGKYAYVANIGSNNVSVINTTTYKVVSTIKVGSEPYNVAVTPNSDYAYVVNYAGDSVSQINTQTNVVVNTIGVGTHPAGISITANGSSVYVTNTGGNSVSVINTTLSYVTTTIAVKSQPFGVAMTQKLPMPTPYPYHVLPVAGYLATKPYGNVTVEFDNVTVDVQFLHAFAITFNAVGRTNSAPWSVTLNGTRQSSSSNAIIFEELNGTYLWNVTLINYYEINPTSGIANVTGGALNITIYFTHIWLINIVEQGLPSGTVWSVTFNGQIYSTNTNTITLRVTNGSVYWYITGISGYLSNPASWENYVSQNYTINVTFSPQPPNPYNLFMQWDFYILLVIVVMPVALYFIFRRRRK